MANMTDQEIRDLMPKDPIQKQEARVKNSEEIIPTTTRRLMIIGCGDGGCNIATAIARKIPDESFVIAYNTSTRNVDEIVADMHIFPVAEDGSGKERDYSKNVFKQNAFKKLLDKVQEVLAELPDIAYIVICTTTDGGTGSGISPMAAKLLSDNTDVPVLLMGVYPSMDEDATSQYNAMQWQSEVDKIKIPYFILDNNQPGVRKPLVHAAVNDQAAVIASLLAGKEFGNSHISIIDNRNLYMLLVQMGGRLIAGIDDTRPTAGQSLDDYVMNILKHNYQPDPVGIRGIGVFVRGPKDVLDKMDTSLPELQKKYGNAVLQFAHIEENASLKIAILLTGNAENSQRITEMKTRYDDIMQAQKDRVSVLGDVLSTTENPLGNTRTKKASSEMDTSALDM